MSDPVRFLGAFAQALAGVTLHGDGHPARERVIDAAYRELRDLQSITPRPVFTFLGDEIIYGLERLKELKSWRWARPLAEAGVQRLEFEEQVSREDFEGFLEEVLARLTLAAIDTSEARQMKRTSIKFGTVSVASDLELPDVDIPTAAVNFSLHDEAEAVRWLHNQVKAGGKVPLTEVEAVVSSLSVAMHGDQDIVVPLLQLREFDQYTTTHSMNMAVLSMGFGEFLRLGTSEVQALGVAGLLHDLGKVRVPIEVLTKPGKLTAEERVVINRHPADGARIILQSEGQMDVAAVVAYEHHIMLNGGGYPPLRWGRDCHYASKLVHVCDVYDALRTRRPYREAWPGNQVMRYLEERAGVEFDPELVAVFTTMMRQWEPQLAVMADENAPLPGASPGYPDRTP